MTHRVTRRPLVTAALLLGVGLGGFVDGILFHQVLQWHNMLSARYPTDSPTEVAEFRRNVEINMFWDGMFHTLTWATTLAGVVALFAAGKRADVPWSGRTLAGGMLLGWGLFNVIEGVIDHHLLHVHHVREDLGMSAWDYGFLGFGLLLAAAGGLLLYSARHRGTGERRA